MLLKNFVLRRIGTISRIVAYISNVKFKEFALQNGQHIFVARICENPGINLAQLTQILDVDKSTTTKVIQKLEKAGYVIKKHNENNKKSFALFPTEKAKEVYKKVIEEENKQIDICFNGFTEEEKKAAVAYLERMCKNLENYK